MNPVFFLSETPVYFIQKLRDMEGIEENEVTFECEISKSKWKKTGTDVDIKWMKGERELRDGIKYSIRKDGCKHSLKLKDLAFEDESNYSAVVLKESTSGRLKILGNFLF